MLADIPVSPAGRAVPNSNEESPPSLGAAGACPFACFSRGLRRAHRGRSRVHSITPHLFTPVAAFHSFGQPLWSLCDHDRCPSCRPSRQSAPFTAPRSVYWLVPLHRNIGDRDAFSSVKFEIYDDCGRISETYNHWECVARGRVSPRQASLALLACTGCGVEGAISDRPVTFDKHQV